MTQQPNIIKVYTKSIAADRTVQLDLIKRYIFPRNCSQRYKIKTVNSKKYDKQLNLRRYSITNKLFEITKEFTFQQNLQIEFTKKMTFLRTKYLKIHGRVRKNIIQ